MAVPLFDTSSALDPLRKELRDAVDRVFDSQRYILGPEVSAFEQEFAAYCGAGYAIGVANGTDAITIALRAMGVGPGDEVVVPSFTFYASAEAIPATGATPVFCDIDPDTYCVTPESVRAVLTPRTKAVIAVHLFGNVAPVAEIEALGVPVLEEEGVPVVEGVHLKIRSFTFRLKFAVEASKRRTPPSPAVAPLTVLGKNAPQGP